MHSRSTHQKRIIYDYIVNSKSHPTINQIYNDLINKGENIGVATCYRNLKSLLNEGKVIQIMTNDNIAHYDYVKDEHLPYLAQRFYRPSGQNEKGSGLGLSIVKLIADHYGLEVNFSNANNGFEVTVN